MIWTMLKLTGFYHCRFSCKSRKRDPYSIMYAYFTAVTANLTLAQKAHEEGKKLYHISYGSAYTNEYTQWRSFNEAQQANLYV